jgi:hypothetical protein
MSWLFGVLLPAAADLLSAPPAAATSSAGLHPIVCGIGDQGSGVQIPQTLHTIEQGISA